MARIVLNTFGSFGDLHPYLALALELQRRNHHCVLATAEFYRQKICAEGIEFAPVRPDVGELMQQRELLEKLWDPARGTVFLLRDYLLPVVAESFADLTAACRQADLLITHAAAYAGPIVAQTLRIPWLSVALQPAIFFSVRDPSVIAAAPWLRHFYPLGSWLYRLLMREADRQTRRWAQPIFELRRSLGLDDDSNPVMHGQFSPFGTLTLFSSRFALAQNDWPIASAPIGFVFYDKSGAFDGLASSASNGLSGRLRDFLAQGPPPVLFTLGSSAVTQAGNFYAESAQAAIKAGVRALLLTGLPLSMAKNNQIYSEQYVPYSEIMPFVSAVVHQGGIGTVAQTLRAGKPMLVVPWAHDQPDNAYRLKRLGVAEVLSRRVYNKTTAAAKLTRLLNDRWMHQRAADLGEQLRQEDGLAVACNRIEALLTDVHST